MEIALLLGVFGEFKQNELKWEPTLKAAEIGVGVKDGVVTLSGYVDSYIKKLVAERASARVFGVRAMAEAIQVRLPDSLKRSDRSIKGKHVFCSECYN